MIIDGRLREPRPMSGQPQTLMCGVLGKMIGVPPEVKGDTDGDGDLNFDDIDDFVAILSGGNAAGTQQVPEPGTEILICLGLGVLVLHRRRGQVVPRTRVV